MYLFNSINQLKMKRWHLLLPGFLVILFVNGCKREISSVNNLDEKKRIQKLQSWVKTHGQLYSTEIINSVENSIPLEGRLDWSQVRKLTSENYFFFEIPFVFSSNNLEKNLMVENSVTKVSTRYKLVIQQEKREEDAIVGRILVNIDSKSTNLNSQNRTIVFFDDLSGKRKSSFLVDNGRKRRIYQSDLGDGLIKSNSTGIYNEERKLPNGCVTISIPVRVFSCWGTPTTQYSYGTTCGYQTIGYNNYTFCSGSGSGSEPGEWENFNNGEYDAAGGFDPNVLQPQVIVDSSIANNPGIDCIYEKLLTDSSADGLMSVLQAFQGESGYNVIFKLKELESNIDGRTHYSGTGNTFEIWINRSNALDTDYSKIWLASTFIHEAFHAKLRQKILAVFGSIEISAWPTPINDMTLKELAAYLESGSHPSNLQAIMHEYMADHISFMKNALQNFVMKGYPALYSSISDPNTSFRDLALQGLEDTQFWKSLYQNNNQPYVSNLGQFSMPNSKTCPQ